MRSIFAFCPTVDSVRSIFAFCPTVDSVRSIFAFCPTVDSVRSMFAFCPTVDSVRSIFASLYIEKCYEDVIMFIYTETGLHFFIPIPLSESLGRVYRQYSG